jgi:hypothetical protein
MENRYTMTIEMHIVNAHWILLNHDGIALS